MLAKKYRLPIQGVTGKKGKSYRGAFFVIKIFSSDKKFSRFGVVVNKKVSKTAVMRNKIKRVFYDTCFLIKDKWPIADYLLIISPTAGNLTQKQIYEVFIQLSFN